MIFSLGPCLRNEAVRLLRIGNESEARWAPRALPDPDCTCTGELLQQSFDRSAFESEAALNGGKMVPDDFLDCGNSTAESANVLLRQAGQNLHQHVAADLARGSA